jgi:tetratricopeptide (TPR) repeat protein
MEAQFRAVFEHYRSGNIKMAEHVCREILRSQPDSAEAHNILGMIFVETGRLDQAISCFHDALNLKSDLDYAYYGLGLASQKKGLHNEAVVHYQKAIGLNPGLFDAYLQLGVIAYNRRSLDEAVSFLLRVLELNPDCEDAYLFLGIISKERAQFDDSIAYLQRALQLNPEHAWAYTNLGVVLQSAGRFEESQVCLKKALQHNPNLGNPHNKVAGLLRPMGDLRDAINAHRQITDKSILICVCTFNRRRITRLSLEQTKRYKAPHCHLQVYDDHSTEYDASFLAPHADEVIQLPEKMGIDYLRWHQFRQFMESGFDFLYMTDSDVLHDPQYVAALEVLYDAGDAKLPVSLYNNIFTMQPGMILLYEKGIMLKTMTDGKSMFYDRAMVEKILARLEESPPALANLPWDNKAVSFLHLPWVVPETSYLEHYGAGGLNNDNYGRDTAINPTAYLRTRRQAVLEFLINDVDLKIDL